jgi:polyisoprenoid-binding protein YceI
MAALGPQSGTILVRTGREGVAARAGHDLVLEVTRWEGRFDGVSIELTADPRSLEVREALHGVKPFSDRDRGEVRRNIEEKVLGGEPIVFRSGSVSRSGDGELVADGDLTIAGRRRPFKAGLRPTPDGRLTATITLAQSDWDITPYRGLMGALKVRDEVEVVIDVPAP